MRIDYMHVRNGAVKVKCLGWISLSFTKNVKNFKNRSKNQADIEPTK